MVGFNLVICERTVVGLVLCLSPCMLSVLCLEVANNFKQNEKSITVNETAKAINKKFTCNKNCLSDIIIIVQFIKTIKMW